MVHARTIHYEIESALGRIHTGWDKDLTAVDIDSTFNQAKDIVLERLDEIIEKNRKLQNHTGELIRPDIPVSQIKTGPLFNSYAIPSDYYNYVKVRATANCIGCQCEETQILETTENTQHDDLNESLKDPDRRPDWYWRKTLYNFSENGLDVYHNQVFNLKEILLTYVKWIPDIATPSKTEQKSYLGSDGVTTYTKDEHLAIKRNSPIWRKMVQVAVYHLKKNLDSNYKVELESILFDENVGMQ